ncbi:MAG: 16S rRNA (cytidine(1402)-2'-O)-methyltransferase [Bryobacterales bacterium]
MAGVLYLVGTPIGNLEDMTYRAVRILREANIIACEDTRRTRGLLSHFGIAGKKLISCHEHNEDARAAELVKRVEAGEKVALVSDAGMPAVSDPGYRVVRAMAEAGLRVEPIPGPSAAIAAVAASGPPTDAFRFCSLLPAKASQRRKRRQQLWQKRRRRWSSTKRPTEIRQTLTDLEELFGTGPIAIARELTKLHEEILRGTPASLGTLIDEPRRTQGRARPACQRRSGETAGDRDPSRGEGRRLDRGGRKPYGCTARRLASAASANARSTNNSSASSLEMYDFALP